MSLGVILFASTHFAIRAEKLAKAKGLPVKLIPIPRHLSSDCGVCLRFSWAQREEIEAALNEAKVNIEGIHQLA